MEEKLSREEILHVANLARIKLTEEEIEKYRVQLRKLLNDVEKINEIMPGFVKTIDQSVFICSYWNEIVERVRVLVEEWFIEWIDIERFMTVNELIKWVINIMCNGKNFHTWYSVEKAMMSTACSDLYWKAIKKVIYSLWIQL